MKYFYTAGLVLSTVGLTLGFLGQSTGLVAVNLIAAIYHSYCLTKDEE